jgi:hypothetical protein
MKRPIAGLLRDAPERIRTSDLRFRSEPSGFWKALVYEDYPALAALATGRFCSAGDPFRDPFFAPVALSLHAKQEVSCRARDVASTPSADRPGDRLVAIAGSVWRGDTHRLRGYLPFGGRTLRPPSFVGQNLVTGG